MRRRLGSLSVNDAFSRDGRRPRAPGPMNRPSEEEEGGLLPPVGALLWYTAENVDGSDNSTMTDLDPVASWHDGGSRGEDCEQVSAPNRPTYRNSGGQEYIDFAGNEILWTAIYAEQAQPYTIAVWAGMATGPSGAIYVIGGDGGGRRHILGRNPGPDWSTFAGTGFVNIQAETLDNYESVVGYFNGASTHLVLNGVDFGPANAGSHADRRFAIGGVAPSLVAKYEGRIKEVLMYAGDERTAIQTYFDLKYGTGPIAF